jgi:multidrug efflux pump subunit AcrA (membrane-fusion protein)
MSSIFSRKPKSVPSRPSWFSRWPKWVRWTALVGLLLVLNAGSFAVVKARQSSSTASTQSTLQTATVRQGNLILEASGTGYLVAASESAISFDVSGKIASLDVKLGDTVQKGQLLAQLDDSSAQTALADAKQTLLELTSPEAIANAELAVTTAKANVINAQYALNNQQYWKNDSLIENYYATYIIAKANLDRAQTAYDNAKVGEYINNANEANAYQSLYDETNRPS